MAALLGIDTGRPGIDSLVLVLFAVLLGFGAWILYNIRFHPLSDVPGPFLASITRLWYVSQVRKGSFDKANRALHQRYGPLVRIAPSEISVNDPEAINTIYGIKSNFTKTDFYPAWKPDGFKTKHSDQFTDTDEAHHSARRRLLNSSYSMSSVLESESYIDEMTQRFMAKLDGFAESGQPCDLGAWLQMYAFDVVGELFFGSAFGFVQTSSDHGGWIATLDQLLPVLVTLALLPNLMRPFYLVSGLMYRSIREGIQNLNRIASVAKQRVGERQDLMANSESKLDGKNVRDRRDILSKLFELKDSKGDKEDFGVADIQLESHVNLFAGSDTTAIALRAIIYQLLTHPSVLKRLLAELDDARARGTLSDPVKYSQAIKLPFFTACVKEAMRLHPSVALQLPRYVPAGGCELAGKFFPAGIRVGVNPAVIHYNQDAFGKDASSFNPDRWLDESSPSMDRYLLTFGGGTRTCIGKNISLSEIHKIVPELLFRFDMALENPNRPLTTQDFWFNKQEGLIVNLSHRKSKAMA